MSVYILVAADAGISNLVTTAQGLDGPCVAVVVGERTVADDVAASGVDRVIWLGDPAGRPLEAFAPAVAELLAAQSAHIVLTAGRLQERALVGAVAARLAAPVYTMVTAAETDETGVIVTHGTFGGVSQETVRTQGPAVLVLEAGSYLAGGATEVPVEEVDAQPLENMTLVEVLEPEHASVDLARARRIVAAGRGVKAREDLALIEKLAAALGAEVACSRPLAEGLGWFNRDRYIGVTGQHVSPDLYLAVGISGQLQHSVGARKSRTVVVINSDKDAPYTKEADYVVVGDLYTVVPALIEALS